MNAEDYKRMAENNIFVTAGMLWHHNSEENQADMLRIFCPVKEIHEAKPTATYFEGRKVFSA